MSSAAEFIDSWLGDKVNSDIVLSFFRTSTPGYLAGGPIRQPYAGVDFIPQSGIYEFGYWVPNSLLDQVKPYYSDNKYDNKGRRFSRFHRSKRLPNVVYVLKNIKSPEVERVFPRSNCSNIEQMCLPWALLSVPIYRFSLMILSEREEAFFSNQSSKFEIHGQEWTYLEIGDQTRSKYLRLNTGMDDEKTKRNTAQ